MKEKEKKYLTEEIDTEENKESYAVPSILKGIGIITIISGVLMGAYTLDHFYIMSIPSMSYNYDFYRWAVAIFWIVGGIISGMTFIGFEKGLELLYGIRDSLNK
jgi:hypothetical protein